MARPKIALYWCSGCGGCEESVLDLGPELVEWTERLEIVFWPVVLDAKRADLDLLADGELAAALVNGAVRTESDRDMLALLRRKARVLIAHGACAQFGGVVGLGNRHTAEALLARSFAGADTTDGAGAGPAEASAAALLLPRSGPLAEWAAVDWSIPGCPPTAALVAECLEAVWASDDRPAGTVFGAEQALCRECPRAETLPDAAVLRRFRRPQDVWWDARRCFLAQELVCLGPATRGGCGARCIGGNAPCRGCFGPLPSTADHGARSAAFLATLLAPDAAPEAATLADPLGLLYRYTLAVSLLPGCGRSPEGRREDDHGA